MQLNRCHGIFGRPRFQPHDAAKGKRRGGMAQQWLDCHIAIWPKLPIIPVHRRLLHSGASLTRIRGMIMALDHSIVSAQREVLRRATDLAHGGTAWKVLASHTGVPEASLHSYGRADAPAAMPVAVLARLCGAVPEALLSLLLPDGWALVRVAELSDPAALASGALEYLGLYSAARHPAVLLKQIKPRNELAATPRAARSRCCDQAP